VESVRLIENFVTWQGEGIDTGRRMLILRFKTCNLKCPWCDTSVKMRINAEANYSIESIQKQIDDNFAGILVTGGEPTVERHLHESLALLNQLNYPLANVETNGYNLFELIQNVSSDKPIKYIFSPKLYNKECYENSKDIAKDVIFHKSVYIKLVSDGSERLEEFLTYLINLDVTLRWEGRIYIMPEGTTKDELIKNSYNVFDLCEKYNVNFSSRDHIIYGFI
jgi:7-carboxy-7-deazaguanine synthase